MAAGSREPGVESVERALAVLDAVVAAGGGGVTLHELAGATGFYKSTILRLGASLEKFGYLKREDGRWRLGAACARLAGTHGGTRDFGKLVQATVESIAAATGETSSYYVRDGDERVCVHRQNSAHAIRHHVEIGDRLPLDRGAAGIAILAFSGAPGARFDRIRRDGWAQSIGLREPDAAGIAAPVFDAHDRLLGAITVSGLRTRFTERTIPKLRDVLLAGVASLEAELGRTTTVRPDAPRSATMPSPSPRPAPRESARR